MQRGHTVSDAATHSRMHLVQASITQLEKAVHGAVTEC